MGTSNAIACCVAVDVNDFCHVGAEEKLLLLMEIVGGGVGPPDSGSGIEHVVINRVLEVETKDEIH